MQLTSPYLVIFLWKLIFVSIIHLIFAIFLLIWLPCNHGNIGAEKIKKKHIKWSQVMLVLRLPEIFFFLFSRISLNHLIFEEAFSNRTIFSYLTHSLQHLSERFFFARIFWKFTSHKRNNLWVLGNHWSFEKKNLHRSIQL